MSNKCNCGCHVEVSILDIEDLSSHISENERQRLLEQRLIAQRMEMQSIREYLDKYRESLIFHNKWHTPEFSLLIACEGMWGIEKRRLNADLKKNGLRGIKK